MHSLRYVEQVYFVTERIVFPFWRQSDPLLCLTLPRACQTTTLNSAILHSGTLCCLNVGVDLFSSLDSRFVFDVPLYCPSHACALSGEDLQMQLLIYPICVPWELCTLQLHARQTSYRFGTAFDALQQQQRSAQKWNGLPDCEFTWTMVTVVRSTSSIPEGSSHCVPHEAASPAISTPFISGLLYSADEWFFCFFFFWQRLRDILVG